MRLPALLLTALLSSGLTCGDAAPPATPAAAPADQGQDLLAERSKGSATAPIRVVEMSDFQCPWCRKFTVESADSLDREYVQTGKVRWIFINFPLTQIHPNAAAAAEMAMCAARRGKFWPMHDLLFRNQERWAPLQAPESYLLTLADSLRIPRDSILPCLREGQTRDLVQRDANTAARIGAQSTPTFLIEGILVGGAYPAEVFRHIIDSIYAERTARR
jgi:protein-disulfide isomerase